MASKVEEEVVQRLKGVASTHHPSMNNSISIITFTLPRNNELVIGTTSTQKGIILDWGFGPIKETVLNTASD